MENNEDIKEMKREILDSVQSVIKEVCDILIFLKYTNELSQFHMK
jgi:hypothetical protein